MAFFNNNMYPLRNYSVSNGYWYCPYTYLLFAHGLDCRLQGLFCTRSPTNPRNRASEFRAVATISSRIIKSKIIYDRTPLLLKYRGQKLRCAGDKGSEYGEALGTDY